jgi:anti-sigma B factor antagonist
MEISEKKVGDARILEPAGNIDTRTHRDLEQRILELFNEGARQYILDFSRVEVITSAGIRVLVKLTKMLGGKGLALCSLNEQVSTVFDIAGFTGFFTIESGRETALTKLQEQKREQKPAASREQQRPRDSKLDSLAKLLLGDSVDPEKAKRRPSRGSGSKLSSHLERLLSSEENQ